MLLPVPTLVAVLQTLPYLFSLGAAGGAVYDAKGGGTNYQCLPRDPQWGVHTDGLHSSAYMHGAEYEMNIGNSPFLKVPV